MTADHLRAFLPGDHVRIAAHGVLYAGRLGLVVETRTPGPKGHCVQVSVHEHGRIWYAPEELEHIEDGTESRTTIERDCAGID